MTRLSRSLALLLALFATAAHAAAHRRAHPPSAHPKHRRSTARGDQPAPTPRARDVVIAPRHVETPAPRTPDQLAPRGIDAAITADRPTRAPSVHELVVLELDGGVGGRQLSFGAGSSPTLRSHTARAVALLGFRLGLYPFARGRRPFLEGLGLTGGFLRSVGARSLVGATGAEQSEVWQAFDVGVHERIRLGRSDRAPWLGLGVSYGQTAYTMSSDGQLLSGMPSVDYRYVRPGLDFRAAFGPVTLAFGAGYRGVVAAGYLGEHFPSGSVRGVDVDASLLVALPKSFAIIVRGQFAQYFYTTNSAPSDVLYASNATDRYGSGTLAVAWLPRM